MDRDTFKEDIGYILQKSPLGGYLRKPANPLKRIKLRMDGMIYEYDAGIAEFLVTHKRAEYV